MRVLGWIFLLLIAYVVWKVFPSETLKNPPEFKAASTQAPRLSVAPPCTASDFVVENFRPSVYDDCRRSSCPSLKLVGQLVNNCKLPAGAQLKFTAFDKAGNIVDTVEGWPASVRNIAPGEKYSFDLGPLMTYRPGMQKYSVQVIDARTW